jgi:hypothetical protein
LGQVLEKLNKELARPPAQAAVGLIALAVAVSAWWRVTDAEYIDAWMPHIVTGLVVVAGTIMLVEWIVSREHAESVRPRTEHTLAELGFAFRVFVHHVFTDYIATHLYREIRIGGDADEILERWIVDEPDSASRMTQELLGQGLEFAELAKDLVDADRETLPPPVVDATYALDAAVGFATSSDSIPHVRWSLRAIVQGVRAFGTAFRPYADPGVFTLFEGTAEIPGDTERPDHRGGSAREPADVLHKGA